MTLFATICPKVEGTSERSVGISWRCCC